MKNAYNARFFIAGFIGASMFCHMQNRSYMLKYDVFGQDGNGGHMLKIVSNLTDEEMARLKYVRRLYWHWKGSRQLKDGNNFISDQELADRGIKMDQEPYIEYAKRPPHDKYMWAWMFAIEKIKLMDLS